MRICYALLTVAAAIVVLGMPAMSENVEAFDMRKVVQNAPLYQPNITTPIHGSIDDNLARNLRIDHNLVDSKYEAIDWNFYNLMVGVIGSASTILAIILMWWLHRKDSINFQNKMKLSLTQHQEQMSLNLKQHREQMQGISVQIEERSHHRKLEYLTESIKHAAKNVIYYGVDNGIFMFYHVDKEQKNACLIKWHVEHFPSKKLFTLYFLLDSKEKITNNILDIHKKLWWNFDLTISLFDDGEYGSVLPSIDFKEGDAVHPNQKYFSEMEFHEFMTILDGIGKIQLKDEAGLRLCEKATRAIRKQCFYHITPKTCITDFGIIRGTICEELTNLSSVLMRDICNIEIEVFSNHANYTYILSKTQFEIYIDIPYMLHAPYINLSSISMKETDANRSLLNSNSALCHCDTISLYLGHKMVCVSWLVKV